MIEAMGKVATGVWQDRRNLFLVVLPWLALAFIGQLFIGANEDLSTVGPLALCGIALRVVALLMAWYCAHSYMIQPTDSPGFLFSPRQGVFIFWQLVYLVVLVLVAILAAVPVIIVANLLYPTLSQDEIQHYASLLSYAVFPVCLWLFGRVILAAPLLVRGERNAAHRSWRATKGLGGRMFVLQLFCLVPAVLGTLLLHTLPFFLIGGLCSIIGMTGSFVLYSRFAEDELKRIGTV